MSLPDTMNAVEIAEPGAGLREGAPDQLVEVIQVAARGDFRHDAAVGAVLVELRQHQVGANLARIGDHRHRGLVAGGFDAQDVHN